MFLLPTMPVTMQNMPGANLKAYLMLPLRIVFTGTVVTIMYPLLLTAGYLRALYLRLVVGKPSQILKYGTWPPPKDGHIVNHRACGHYPCQQLFSKPLDEAKLRKALVGLAAEDGIKEEEVSLKFFAEEPMDWPSTGSYDTTSAFLKSYPKGRTYINASAVESAVAVHTTHTRIARAVACDRIGWFATANRGPSSLVGGASCGLRRTFIHVQGL